MAVVLNVGSNDGVGGVGGGVGVASPSWFPDSNSFPSLAFPAIAIHGVLMLW